MFFAKIPRPIRQNAITEGDLECILARNCEGTEQLRNFYILRKCPEYEIIVRKRYKFFERSEKIENI